ncbi:hypothetical protein IHE45_07G032400 [Dioscorea alata]|uniref:Uncharacterized protein n=1 Tax=Dioscorea alata TaxID=55571 RepID=A0ACB7VQT3_DIOAL|nr:hypothetical protein IHE45_07G032400 [Dioscorea alata]
MDATGHLVNSTTVNALFETAAELYGINREAIRGVIQLRTEISTNINLSEWLQVQFMTTMQTLHAMDVLKHYLHQARPMVLLISRHGADRVEMLGKLKDLETMRMRSSVQYDFKLACHEHQKLGTVLGGLRQRKHDLDHKLDRIKAWRKAWNAGLWIAKFGVTVLSVVLPVAGELAAAIASNNAASGAIALLQPLADSHLADQQSSCEDERDLTVKILNEACFIFHRFNSVRDLVQPLEDQMGLLAEYAEFLAVAGEDEDGAVSMAMEKIKGKALELVDDIEELENEVDRSWEDLRRAALTLLQTATDQIDKIKFAN